MPVSGFGVPSTLSAQDMGVPNYGNALKQGLQNAQLGMETYYKPKNLQEALLHQQLANKMSASNLSMQPTRHQMLSEQLQSLRTQNQFQPQNLQEALNSKRLENEKNTILNSNLPDKIKSELLKSNLENQEKQRIADLKRANPTFGQPGVGGVLGTLRTMDQFPEYYSNNVVSQPPSQNQMPMNQQESFIPSAFEQQQQPQKIQQGQQAQEEPNIYDQFRQALIAQYANKNRGTSISPQEKLKNDILLAQEKERIKQESEEKKQNYKKKEELLKEARTLKGETEDVGRLKKLMATGLKTGYLPALGAKVGIGADRLGTFNEVATRLQGKLAHDISARGGAVAAQIAEKGKPSEWRKSEYNKQMIKSMTERFSDQYDDLKEEYEKLGIGKFPYNKHEFFKNSLNKVYVISPTGNKILMSKEDAEDAVKLHGGRYAE